MQVFNIGSDETSAKGRCTVNTSFSIERRVLNAIQNDFKKTPAGWEEVALQRPPDLVPGSPHAVAYRVENWP